MAKESLQFQLTKNLMARSAEEREALLAEPGFGVVFTDHMVDICWSLAGGWHRPRVQPYGDIPLSPAAAILHYGQEVFEGLKAYRHADGSIWTFRPEMNSRRMNRSAKRLALPELPEEYFLQSLKELIKYDASWVPSAPETSLYLRPFMFAKEAFLGVRSAQKVAYYLIASPAGPYFKGGIKPISIWLSEQYSRAGKGGTGAAKTGGNYAASLAAQNEAADNGCQQVLFLDAETNTHIDELGGMNIFFVYGGKKLVTPIAGATILEGVTRDSIITLAKDRGLEVEERDVTIAEVQAAAASGEITEMFACGTAAVITPIAQIKAKNFEINVGGEEAGELTSSIRAELTGIQYGTVPDRHGWLYQLDGE